MQDDSPGPVEHLLEYLYTYQFPEISERGRFQTILELFEVADKYGVHTLKEQCRDRLIETLRHVEEVSKERRRRRKCYVTTSYVRIAERLWEMKQPGIEEVRIVCLDLLISNLDELLKSDDFTNVLASLPEFSYDLIQAMNKRLPRENH